MRCRIMNSLLPEEMPLLVEDSKKTDEPVHDSMQRSQSPSRRNSHSVVDTQTIRNQTPSQSEDRRMATRSTVREAYSLADCATPTPVVEPSRRRLRSSTAAARVLSSRSGNGEHNDVNADYQSGKFVMQDVSNDMGQAPSSDINASQHSDAIMKVRTRDVTHMPDGADVTVTVRSSRQHPILSEDHESVQGDHIVPINPIQEDSLALPDGVHPTLEYIPGHEPEAIEDEESDIPKPIERTDDVTRTAANSGVLHVPEKVLEQIPEQVLEQVPEATSAMNQPFNDAPNVSTQAIDISDPTHRHSSSVIHETNSQNSEKKREEVGCADVDMDVKPVTSAHVESATATGVKLSDTRVVTMDEGGDKPTILAGDNGDERDLRNATVDEAMSVDPDVDDDVKLKPSAKPVEPESDFDDEIRNRSIEDPRTSEFTKTKAGSLAQKTSKVAPDYFPSQLTSQEETDEEQQSDQVKEAVRPSMVVQAKDKSTMFSRNTEAGDERGSECLVAHDTDMGTVVPEMVEDAGRARNAKQATLALSADEVEKKGSVVKVGSVVGVFTPSHDEKAGSAAHDVPSLGGRDNTDDHVGDQRTSSPLPNEEMSVNADKIGNDDQRAIGEGVQERSPKRHEGSVSVSKTIDVVLDVTPAATTFPVGGDRMVSVDIDHDMANSVDVDIHAVKENLSNIAESDLKPIGLLGAPTAEPSTKAASHDAKEVKNQMNVKFTRNETLTAVAPESEAQHSQRADLPFAWSLHANDSLSKTGQDCNEGDHEMDDPSVDESGRHQEGNVDPMPISQDTEDNPDTSPRRQLFAERDDGYFSESPLPSPRVNLLRIDNSTANMDMLVVTHVPSEEDESPQRQSHVNSATPSHGGSVSNTDRDDGVSMEVAPSHMEMDSNLEREAERGFEVAPSLLEAGSALNDDDDVEVVERDDEVFELHDTDTRTSTDEGVIAANQADEDVDEDDSVKEDSVEREEIDESRGRGAEQAFEDAGDAESEGDGVLGTETENNASSHSAHYEESNQEGWDHSVDIPSDEGVPVDGNEEHVQESEESKSSEGSTEGSTESRSGGRSPRRASVESVGSDEDIVSDAAGEDEVEENESEGRESIALDGEHSRDGEDVEVILLSSVGSDDPEPEESDGDERDEVMEDAEDGNEVEIDEEVEVDEEEDEVDDEGSTAVVEIDERDEPDMVPEEPEQDVEAVGDGEVEMNDQVERNLPERAPTAVLEDSRSGIIAVRNKGEWNVTGEGDTSRPVPSPEASQIGDLIGDILYAPRGQPTTMTLPSAVLLQTRNTLAADLRQAVAGSNAASGSNAAVAASEAGRSYSQTSVPHGEAFAPPPSPLFIAIEDASGAAEDPGVVGHEVVDILVAGGDGGSMRSAEVDSGDVKPPTTAGAVSTGAVSAAMSAEGTGGLLPTSKRKRNDEEEIMAVNGPDAAALAKEAEVAVERPVKKQRLGIGEAARARNCAMPTPDEAVLGLRPMFSGSGDAADSRFARSTAANQSILDRLARIEQKEKCREFDPFRDISIGDVVQSEAFGDCRADTNSGNGAITVPLRAFHQGVTGIQSRVGVLRSKGVRGATRSRLKVVNVSRLARAKALEEESIRKMNEATQRLSGGRRWNNQPSRQ